jgi:hypothetical protein
MLSWQLTFSEFTLQILHTMSVMLDNLDNFSLFQYHMLQKNDKNYFKIKRLNINSQEVCTPASYSGGPRFKSQLRN